MQRVIKERDFKPISHSIAEMSQNTATVTMEGVLETIHKLSNGTIFNELDRPLTPNSRSHYQSPSNMWKMVQDRAILTMADQ